jgi:hypothetical protein
LHTWLAAEKHPADGEFLKVAVKKKGVSKITRKNTNTSLIQKRWANL